MVYGIIKLTVYLICFLAALYALSGVQFDRFVNVKQPMKAQVLLFVAGDGTGLSVRNAHPGADDIQWPHLRCTRSSSSMRTCTGSWRSRTCCHGKN